MSTESAEPIAIERLLDCKELKITRNDGSLLVFEVQAITFDQSGHSCPVLLEISVRQFRGNLRIDDATQIQVLAGSGDVPRAWTPEHLASTLDQFLLYERSLRGMSEVAPRPLEPDEESISQRIIEAANTFDQEHFVERGDLSQLPDFISLCLSHYLQLHIDHA